MDDQTIVQRVLKKDPQAERYFYETYRSRLHRFTTYLLGYKDGDIEDVVQESILSAFRKLHEFEFRSSLSHWIYRICAHRCYKRIRQRRRMVASLDEELEGFAKGSAVAHSSTQDHDQELQAYREVIIRERDKMDSFCRKILELRDEEGRSYAWIAEALRVPIGTVMSRLSRCKETLKRVVLKAARKEGLIHE